MADNTEGSAATESKAHFDIQKIYVKDVSFETPNSPQIFNSAWEPKTTMQINSVATKLSDSVYEVVLSLTVTTMIEDKTAYLIEVHQAGIFTVHEFSNSDRDAMLGSFCPNVLYSFARATIADLIGKGGFPVFYLKPINFDAMYMQQLEARNASASTATVQ